MLPRTPAPTSVPAGMRPKAAGRYGDGIYLHHESNGTGGDEDPRWEPVDPVTAPWPSEAQARLVRCPLPQVFLFRPLHGYDRDQPTLADVFAAPGRYATASASRITSQDGGGFTSTSTPANNWW